MTLIETRQQIWMPAESASLAQKLAWKMVQVDASRDEIMALFSDKATFIFDTKEGQKEMDRKQFSQELQQRSIENIVNVGFGKHTFKPWSENPNVIIWKIENYQERLGKGYKEDGPGWYFLKQKIFLEYTEEHNQIKISKFTSKASEKIKQLSKKTALPLTQSMVQELSFRSFQIPQKSDEMVYQLYDPKAISSYPDGGRFNREKFANLMQNSNQRVLKIGKLITSYLPVEENSKQVEWNVDVVQKKVLTGERKLNATVRIEQKAIITFTENVGKEKIILQNNYATDQHAL